MARGSKRDLKRLRLNFQRLPIPASLGVVDTEKISSRSCSVVEFVVAARSDYRFRFELRELKQLTNIRHMTTDTVDCDYVVSAQLAVAGLALRISFSLGGKKSASTPGRFTSLTRRCEARRKKTIESSACRRSRLADASG